MEPEVVAFPDMTSKWLRHVKENLRIKCLSNTACTNINVIHIHPTKSYKYMRSIFINYMIYFDLNDPYITPSESSTKPHLWTKAPTVHPRHLQLLEVEVQEVENKGKMPRPGCWSHSFFLGKKTRIEKMR